MEIWLIKIECVSVWHLKEKIWKICEIPNRFTLAELCYFILDCFEFDNDHLHEFFVSRKFIYSEKTVVENEKATLANIFPLEKNYHLFMHFDFGDDWIFKISRGRKKIVFDENQQYPRIAQEVGENPLQYPMCEEEY